MLRWLRLEIRLETTGDGVEIGLLRAFVGSRAITVIQLGVAVTAAVDDSPRPWLDGLLAVAFVCETVALCWAAMRRGSLALPRWAYADTAFGVALLACQPLIADQAVRLDTWNAWGYAVTLSCAGLAALALGRIRSALWASSALAAAYLAATLRIGDTFDHSWTAATNALGYPAIAAIGWGTASYLRRLGADADRAREEASRAATEAETERHRLLLHDQASVLHLVAAGLGDPDLDDALRHQARRAAAAVSAFMTGVPARPGASTLSAVVAAAAADFPDLPLTLNVDLAEGVPLSEPAALTLTGALRTLLHNVRQHAGATECVVHADATREVGAWEVVVRDDGVGFDPQRVEVGYGLSRQVRRAAASVGIHVDVTSAPGEGTAVTLRQDADPSSGSVRGFDSDEPDRQVGR